MLIMILALSKHFKRKQSERMQPDTLGAHAALAEKERANVQFNFLKETNSLFGFFTALCDAYSRALLPPKDLSVRLRADATDTCVAPLLALYTWLDQMCGPSVLHRSVLLLC